MLISAVMFFSSAITYGQTFTRITEGDIVNDGGSYGSAWADYDNDGDLDLFATGGKLYENNGDGTFSKILLGPIISDGGGIAGTWGDYDNDGDIDLLVASFWMNFLYSNNGDGSFTKISTGPLVTDSSDFQGASWGDYDNDGDLDIFVSSGGNVGNVDNFLYSNNGDGTFTKITTGAVVNDG